MGGDFRESGFGAARGRHYGLDFAFVGVGLVEEGQALVSGEFALAAGVPFESLLRDQPLPLLLLPFEQFVSLLNNLPLLGLPILLLKMPFIGRTNPLLLELFLRVAPIDATGMLPGTSSRGLVLKGLGCMHRNGV